MQTETAVVQMNLFAVERSLGGNHAPRISCHRVTGRTPPGLGGLHEVLHGSIWPSVLNAVSHTAAAYGIHPDDWRNTHSRPHVRRDPSLILMLGSLAALQESCDTTVFRRRSTVFWRYMAGMREISHSDRVTSTILQGAASGVWTGREPPVQCKVTFCLPP
jgi:hypothetical protein